jgi:hypothetical protein
MHLIRLTISRFLPLCMVVAVASVATDSRALTIAYANPAGANDFAVDANWVDGVAPGLSDIGLIDGVDGVTDYAYLDSTRSIQRFTIATDNGNMGGLELRNGGNLTALASSVSYIGARGPGHLRLLNGSALATSNTLFVGWGDLAGHGTGTVTQSGGSFSTTAGITMGVSAADTNFAASAGTYNLNSGNINLGSTLIVGLAGNGTFNMNGGSVTTGNFLQIGRTGNGTFTQTAGTLSVNRSSSEAMVIGAVAGGIGKYEISGGSMSVTTSGAGGVALGVAAGTASGTFKIVGSAPTSISITGDYTQNPNSNLSLDIGTGITPISLTGNAKLDGSLNVKFTTTPTPGQAFTIMNYGGTLTGNFALFDNLVDSPAGPNTVPLLISYGSGTADAITLKVALPGDYDKNGIVESADYGLWRQLFGTVGTSDADGNNDSVVDGADYVIWRRGFSAGGSGSGIVQGAAVPEPRSLVLFCLAAVGLHFYASNRRRKLCATN